MTAPPAGRDPARDLTLADVPPGPWPWRKVVVLGGPGAGKSHLARSLGAALAVPVVHLDSLHWEPGWRRPTDAAFRARVEAALVGDGWITDGLYLVQADDLLVPRADLVIWIEQPAWLRLWRCLARTAVHWGRPRADRAEGCPERLDPPFLYFALTFDRWKPFIAGRLAAFPQARLLRLDGDRDIDALLQRLAMDGANPP